MHAQNTHRNIAQKLAGWVKTRGFYFLGCYCTSLLFQRGRSYLAFVSSTTCYFLSRIPFSVHSGLCVVTISETVKTQLSLSECGTIKLEVVGSFLAKTQKNENSQMMMMNAFITINSGLVPLIEGLCAQILQFRFEIIGALRSHLLLFFFVRKNMLKKTAVSARPHPASQHVHTHVYFVHIYEYMCAEIQSIWILRALQVSHPDYWAHIQVPHLCCVGVCVRIFTHTPTYTPTRVKI